MNTNELHIPEHMQAMARRACRQIAGLLLHRMLATLLKGGEHLHEAIEQHSR